MQLLTIFKLLDKYIGTILCLFFGLFRKQKPLSDFAIKKTNTILFVKLIAIGDLVVILPLIKAFKDNFPKKQIILLTSPRVKEVVEGCPYIDEIIYPRQTRKKLIQALEMTQNKSEQNPPKKHGNIPL